MDILKTENISYGYNKNSKIISNINFSMDSSQVIGLFGDSGAGKSTFCKILSNFITDYSGSVLINDSIIDSKFNPVQLIFQHPEKVMNPHWSMDKILSESWNPDDDILDEFGIKKEWLKRYPSELSGGELQRFSILRAINPKTRFIIADEITTMLDAVTQVQIWSSLLNYTKKNDIGVLCVSHDIALLERICDDILYFDKLNQI